MYVNFKNLILYNKDPEITQNRIRQLLHLIESNKYSLKAFEKLVNNRPRFSSSKLKVNIAGIDFENPLLVAAGWDKVGTTVKSVKAMGFGGIEVGTVVAYPQNGNPSPRLHDVSKDVLLNYMGFPSPGMEKVAQKLEKYRNLKFPIGINVGKNKHITPEGAPFMHAVVVRRLYDFATYFTLGISSPNTPNLKLLQEKIYLVPIIRAMNEMMIELGGTKPLFIKIAPDLSEETLDKLLEVVMEEQVAGIIAANTYAHPNLIAKYGQRWEEARGGISGNDKEYKNVTTRLIANIYKKTEGKVPIIGVGGINSSETAIEKIQAGASLLQLLTGLYVHGQIANKINKGIVINLERENIENINKLIGTKSEEFLKDSKSIYLKKLPELNALKKEYLDKTLLGTENDILLIRKELFELKHGEFNRKTSHIYLNHKSQLFSVKNFHEFLAKLIDTFIKEKTENYFPLSISDFSSPTSNAIVTQLKKQNKSYEENIFIIDDVFTSGQSLKETFEKVKSNTQINGVVISTRNPEVIENFNNQNEFQVKSLFNLDEIIKYNWKKLTEEQKQLVQLERLSFQ